MPINKETIISVFDEKLTLMQWLKTINKALEDAVLTGVEITKKGNATLSFKFTFEDGTFLETNDIVLQQGESINGAYIQNGHLYLTLTNSQTLDAGNVKPVSNFAINDSQHLIVNYADGTNQDLGAIFQGNVNIDGSLGVTGNVTINSKLSANEVDGEKVTGNEIVEKMTGYSIEKNTSVLPSEAILEYVYVGVVKTGNKITFALAVNVTIPTASLLTDLSLGFVFCPNDVMAKLYETNIGGSDVLSAKEIGAFPNTFSNETIRSVCEKFSTSVKYTLNGLQGLTKDQKYFIRVEDTFLLSDNLAL